MSVIAKQFCRAKPKCSSVYFTSKQILPFGFSGQNCDPYAFNSLDLSNDKMCVQAQLNVYHSGDQMLAALAHNFTIIRTTATILACTYLIIFLRQIEGLHGAYNTLYTDWKLQCYTIGWDMASCNINNRPVPWNIIFTTHIYTCMVHIYMSPDLTKWVVSRIFK